MLTKGATTMASGTDTPENRAFVQREFGNVVGRTITRVRVLTDDDMESSGWEGGYGNVALEFVLDDGRSLVPSADPEGNGPGFIFVN